MVYKLTLDESRVQEISSSAAFPALKQRHHDGKVEIFDPRQAKASGKTERRPAPWEKRAAAGAMFQRIASILFPQRDPKRLSMMEINDVAHLLAHQQSGREIFVTTNTKDFVNDGKQAQLQMALKIVVLTPEEAVTAIDALGKMSPSA